eukprot:g13819.t1
MVEEAGVGLSETDLDGRFLYVNRTLAQMIGFESAEALLADGANSGDYYADPEDQRSIRAAVAQTGEVRGRLLRARRRDGSTFWVSEHSTPIRDAQGAITGYVASIADVDALVAAQARLAEAEASYRRIFERATEGIYRSSLDGKQLRSNPALYRLNGYDSEAEHLEAVQDIATEWYVEPTRRDDFKRLLERDGVVEDFESEIYRHKTRERIWISENAYLVRDAEGRPLYYEGTVRDITARKRAELATQEALKRAEAANKAKTDFLAHMSHELRTPLNAILGFSDLLRMTGAALSPQKVRDYADDIHQSGAYLLDLINDVLDLSRVESGAAPMAMEPLEAAACIDAALDTVRPLAQAKGLALDTAGVGAERVLADRRAVQQCLLNLLSNAIKFAPEGSRIALATAREPEGRILFAVRDEGPGAPGYVLARLGEPFVIHDDPRRANQTGSGLGLAITRTLTERMGGALRLVNRPEGGAEAALILPAAE